MNTLVANPRRADARTRRPPFTALLRSEWVKLLSVPSSVLALAGILSLGLAGAAFLGLTLESSGVPSTPDLARTVGDITMPTVILGQILAGILGVMVIGSEYATGTIQPTLLAVPERWKVLVAKVLVLFSTVMALALATVFAAWAITTLTYAPHGLDAPLSEPGVLLALIGTAVYIGLCAVFGVGIGTIVRSTTVGTIVVFFATLLGPVLSSFLPEGMFGQVIRMLLIGNAGDAMSRMPIDGAPFLDLHTGYISPLAGYAFVSGWAILSVVIGAIMLQKRDA